MRPVSHSSGMLHDAHLLPDDSCLPARAVPPTETLPIAQAQASSSASSNVAAGSSSTTTAAATSPTVDGGFGISDRSLRTRQRSRLQLRNAGFRAAPITNRRVSPFTILSRSQETSPSASTALGSGILSNPAPPPLESNILRELHRSTRRRKESSGRPSLTGLFEADCDDGSKGGTTRAGNNDIMSPRREYSKQSPVNDENAAPTHTSSSGHSPYSSVSKPLTSRKTRFQDANRILRRTTGNVAPRVTSLQTSAYIDSLEAEVASLETRLSTVNSPSLTSQQSTKLRSLTAQNRNLRQEITDWEERFEARVQDAVFERTRFEADLKRKVRELEDDVRDREERAFILETRAKEFERRATQAEESEKMMSGRVDMLTSMVAKSPPQGAYGWATAPTTPAVIDFPAPLRPIQRVQSALVPPIKAPKSPKRNKSSSPSRRETITSAEDVFGWHTAAENTEPADSDCAEVSEDAIHASSSSSTHMSDQQSILTVSTQPTSLDMAEVHSPARRERPMSLLSTSSFSASWGLPASLGRSYTDGPNHCNDNATKQLSQAKKTRRFLSSAGGLKPLILPSTASSASSNPLSSPRRMSLLSPSRLGSVSKLPINGSYPISAPVENIRRAHSGAPTRGPSGISMQSDRSFDPTTAFFEASVGPTPDKTAETPTLAARRRSKELRVARELERLKALRQLEGGSSPNTIDQMISEMSAEVANNNSDGSSGVRGIHWQRDSLLNPRKSTLAEELGGVRATSFGTVVSPATNGVSSDETTGWMNDLASAPSTPPRSRSSSFSETPKGPEHPYVPSTFHMTDSTKLDMRTCNHLPRPTTGGPIFQTPRISIQGTVSHASSGSAAISITEVPDDRGMPHSSASSAQTSFFERLARLASTVLPFRRDQDATGKPGPGRRSPREALKNSQPVLLARRILERSRSRTEILSPFRLGGLGWWLFGLLHWRTRHIDQGEAYHAISSATGNGPPNGTRPRQVSCGTEERQIGITTNPIPDSGVDIDPGSLGAFTPEQLRRLELDGPGECTLMRSEPYHAAYHHHLRLNEHSALMGLPGPISHPHLYLPPTPQASRPLSLVRVRSYGSISPSVEQRANSVVDRVFGPSAISCARCVEPEGRRKLRAWTKFGLALVLAVGVAVLEGPESVMAEQGHEPGCAAEATQHARRDSEDWRDEVGASDNEREEMDTACPV